VRLFGRRKPRGDAAAREEAGSDVERVDAIVDPYASRGDWSGLAGALDAIVPDALDKQGAVAWYQGRGMAAAHLGDREQARSIYEAGLSKHPRSSLLQLVVGRLYEEGRFEEARPHLAAVRLEEGGQFVMAAAWYCYLWDAWQEAAALLDQLFGAYFELGVGDDEFLYTRDLPFFSDAFGARAAIAVLAGKAGEAKDLLDRAERDLSDLDAEPPRLTLQAWLGDPAPLIGGLERELNVDGENALSGFNGMRLAVWRSRDDEDPEHALRRLDAVSIGRDDFPWLEHVRILAKARVLRGGGDTNGAEKFVRDFMDRQPLLFEPWHAFYFGLLDEQELVKRRYRELRRSGQPPRAP
jgi:tetratricopeptide (TPR) repeat protein